MMKTVIENFIQDKNLALVGASRNPKKWGYMLFRDLKKKGYKVHPVNRNSGEIEGEKCYQTVSELPQGIKNVIISLPPEKIEMVVKECNQAGIKRIWIHKGMGGKSSKSGEAVQYCKNNGIEVVYDFCPLMFFPPVGFHKIHFWLKKIAGRFPDDFK